MVMKLRVDANAISHFSYLFIRTTFSKEQLVFSTTLKNSRYITCNAIKQGFN